MRDKMPISVYILKIAEKDPLLIFQMRAKDDSIVTNFFHK